MTHPNKLARRKRQKAAAAVEFAILFPFLMFFLIGSVDLARIMQTSISIESGFRAGFTKGASLLNEIENQGLRDKENDNDVIIPEGLENEIETAANNEGAPNINFQVESIRCRCPIYDSSAPISSDTLILPCIGQAAIQDCDLPEIVVDISATAELNLFYGGKFGLPVNFEFLNRTVSLAVR